MFTNNNDNELAQIFHLLKEKVGVDFAKYKPSTMGRRIRRRMALTKADSVPMYHAYLRDNPDEVEALHKDLLINVTRFFRDARKYEMMERMVFPVLMKNYQRSKRPIRIWDAGTATGEEAYSISIAFMEYMEHTGEHAPFQVFATDLNQTSIDWARRGIYSSTIQEHVSAERLDRYFVKVDEGYQVRKEVRDTCIFAVHDLAQDPPFSNLDLICCLNVLIYFGQTLQNEILDTFHYALIPTGFLLLGSSESIGAQKRLFQTLDPKEKLYVKQPEKSNGTNNHTGSAKGNGFTPTKYSVLNRYQRNIPKSIDISGSRAKNIEKLREALESTRIYADSIIDELNSLTEELHSANQELIGNNEELQTANEELETSQEELQAANEELLTLNQELQKREETQNRLAWIVESSDDAIISKDINGVITSWNHGAQRLYGYKPEEIVGKSIDVLMPSEKKSDFTKLIKLLRQGKRVEHYETRRMTKDGRILDVALTVSPLRDKNGTIIGASKIARDITEKKRNEANMRFLSEASKQFAASLDYQATLRAIGKLSVAKLADRCFVYLLPDAGQQHPEIIISARDERTRKKLQKYTEQFPTQPDGKTLISKALQTKKSILMEQITDEDIVKMARNEKHKEALQKLQVRSAMVVPLQAYKSVIGAIMFQSTTASRQFDRQDLRLAQELAARAALAIENAKLYRDAQKAITIRDDFISIASHELRTPVTSLKLYTQVLEKQFQMRGEETVSRYLGKMDRQIDSLNKLVRDMLDISRMQHGELEFQISEFDLNEQVKETVEHIQATSRKHRIIIEGSVSHTVMGDMFRIDQVLVNLLTNAIKYSPKADKVVVRIREHKRSAVIEVQDFGIGIDKKDQANIFKRFYRVDGPKEKTYPGLGIGLYISHEIIRRHGGRIRFVSVKNEGSCFSFSLPFHVKKGKNMGKLRLE